MDTIRKLFNFEVKQVEDRVLRFTGSTETLDRDGEVIKVSGWDLDNYKKNPVFMWAHDYSQPPIGKAVNVHKRQGNLIFDIEFADKDTYEFADTIYKLYQGGFLRATSVGFIPDPDGVIEGDGVKTPRRTYTRQELLELSAVPVPSNPDALRNAADKIGVSVKSLKGIFEDAEIVDLTEEKSYTCECIKCGHKIESDEHCKDLKCPKCGGQMRRAERPGQGEEEGITKPEETDDYLRIPVDSGDHEGHRIRTILISNEKGIKAIYCGTCKKVMTYLFSKEKGWTMEKAKEWIKEHGKSVCLVYSMLDLEAPIEGIILETSKSLPTMDEKPIEEVHQKKEISQCEITDELDYISEIIEKGDFSEENKKSLKKLAEKIRRVPGCDIPVKISDDERKLIINQAVAKSIQ